jgi:hypothetical protein
MIKHMKGQIVIASCVDLSFEGKGVARFDQGVVHTSARLKNFSSHLRTASSLAAQCALLAVAANFSS